MNAWKNFDNTDMEYAKAHIGNHNYNHMHIYIAPLFVSFRGADDLNRF